MIFYGNSIKQNYLNLALLITINKKEKYNGLNLILPIKTIGFLIEFQNSQRIKNNIY